MSNNPPKKSSMTVTTSHKTSNSKTRFACVRTNSMKHGAEKTVTNRRLVPGKRGTNKKKTRPSRPDLSAHTQPSGLAPDSIRGLFDAPDSPIVQIANRGEYYPERPEFKLHA